MSKRRDSESEDEEIDQLQFKIIILGDGAVGKTSSACDLQTTVFVKLTNKQLAWTSSSKNLYFQVLDFFIKKLVLPGDIHVALQIWDIGGQSIGSKMINNYIYGAQAVLLTYDVTSYESFQNLEDWYRLVTRTFEREKMPYVALIGNKSDLNHMRAVRQDSHNQFADENDMFGFMMSAKSGDQVSACFYRIAAALSGVVLTRPELEVATEVIPAQIVAHQQHDPTVNEGKVPEYTKSQKNCIIFS
eukprot:CAMPEP_0117857062 /NCGR_PEP_ID=MMETSP0950-20121206/1648_1 /TAXON_ID=44440 /ORGANISM="Chattonella subsalsa, Strain CCMP2191" /LENGTH=244 /DNA_ID=CAMNT_0005706341 /DNA_START=20 /DNA_END=755 /DNA_ORIENTATION=+